MGIIDQLFIAYIVIAIAYNLANLSFNELTGKPLSPSEPMTSITMLATLYLVYFVTGLNDIHHYVRVFMLLTYLILIFRLGIIRHLINYDEQQYFSPTSRILAVIINMLGVALLLCSVVLTLF